MTHEELRAAILKAEPGIDQESEVFHAQMVLLASAIEGPNVQRLTKLSGAPRRLVAKFGHNLRKNGVWRGKKVYANWADEKEGGVAFQLDVLVAMGLMAKHAG